MLACCFKWVSAWIVSPFFLFQYYILSRLISESLFFFHANTTSVYARLKAISEHLYLFVWGFSLVIRACSIHVFMLHQPRSAEEYPLLRQSSTNDWWMSIYKYPRSLTPCVEWLSAYVLHRLLQSSSRLKLQWLTCIWLVSFSSSHPIFLPLFYEFTSQISPSLSNLPFGVCFCEKPK